MHVKLSSKLLPLLLLQTIILTDLTLLPNFCQEWVHIKFSKMEVITFCGDFFSPHWESATKPIQHGV